MGTVSYDNEPGDTVWIITGGGDCPLAIQEGEVVQVKIKIFAVPGSPPVDEIIVYDVRIGDDVGTTPIDSSDIFGNTSHMGSPLDNGKAAALAEYNNRLALI